MSYSEAFGAVLFRKADKFRVRLIRNLYTSVEEYFLRRKGKKTPSSLFDKKKLNQMLAQSTGKMVSVIEADCDHNNWMTALEAMEYGLIDKVVEQCKKQ